ncbi:PREDICTED: scarecrow-like protein 11 [Ipomoea nil]|uniref:scarecrow-like protein 11 n=1 Tax=Ipomoea nil TaxID=35883 RepID=UPI000901F15C|nr:PREDICTED: scarecrow-like protein 11 [Ipomoea nil]
MDHKANNPSSSHCNYFQGVLDYINQMLMEDDDLENGRFVYPDLLALQAAEKSLGDVLNAQESSGNDAGRRGDKRHRCGEDINDQWAVLLQRIGSISKARVQARAPARRGRPRGGERGGGNVKEEVDLAGLLNLCAQAVWGEDFRTVNELLGRIRRHCSLHGGAAERLSHYFAKALDARLAGTGAALYTANRGSLADTLKAYQMYFTACPFKKLSNMFADKSIGKLTMGATKIHIIDFGISHGFQWPCLIQGLSRRPGGPPALRITGIDLPEPADRLEATGRHLSYYSKKFNVPFQYTSVRKKKWETICSEDVRIERDEVLVVNCLYRLQDVPDETTALFGSTLEDSPRDTILKFIKQLNPHVFVHGVVSASYNALVFSTRFREAIFHFSSLFDMLEGTVPGGDEGRVVFEREILGREIMNVVACEGADRMKRPETYKQWQERSQRGGFEQMWPDGDIMRQVRAKVKDYSNDFFVEEDGKWMLQGWKGRVIYAISCWKPECHQ